jgi:anaerobic dimethyl sulfoxide reductase subunit B (iron-sulfur subunit)
VHDLDVGTFFRRVTDYEGGKFPHVWAASLSMGCNHCEKPQCLSVCPVAAISKNPETGLVTQDLRMCIVCERCVRACPYGSPQYIPNLIEVRKCDACANFLRIGEKPACVAACSTRCLQFGDLEELKEKYGPGGLVNDLPVLPSPAKTNPSVLIKPKPEIFTLPPRSEAGNNT